MRALSAEKCSLALWPMRSVSMSCGLMRASMTSWSEVGSNSMNGSPARTTLETELWTRAHDDAVGRGADHRAIEHRLRGARLLLDVGDGRTLGVELGDGVLDAGWSSAARSAAWSR